MADMADIADMADMALGDRQAERPGMAPFGH
jgi:hypothetical protein